MTGQYDFTFQERDPWEKDSWENDFYSLSTKSSAMMCDLTLYRNKIGFSHKLLAQVGYPIIALIALVETVFLAATSILLFCQSTSPAPMKKLKSSVFVIGWSMVAFCLNPFFLKLVPDEPNALFMFNRRFNKDGSKCCFVEFKPHTKP